MGLSIYYQGIFNPKSSLPEMIEEVIEISETHKWSYYVFENEFPRGSLGRKTFNEKVYGILFGPVECEPVILTFLSNGKMCSPFLFEHWLESEKKEPESLIYGNFTKTQYAGAEVHKAIIYLLRYLSKKYFKEFKLKDEGEYWESNNEQLLYQTFGEWDALIDRFADELTKMERNKGETLENTIIRAAEKTYRKKKK